VAGPANGSLILSGTGTATPSPVTARIAVVKGARLRAVRLNGRPVPFGARTGRSVAVRLTATSGLRFGHNRIHLRASRGSGPVSDTASGLTVARRVTGILSVRVRTGGTHGPAEALLRVPPPETSRLTVAVNGRGASGAFGPRNARGIRHAGLAAHWHLRPGVNVLRAQVVTDDGRLQTVVRRFTLPSSRHLIGARALDRVHVGSPVRLQALAAHLPGVPRASAAMKAQALAAVRWTLVRRPVNSAVGIGTAVGQTTTITPDVPGRYRVRLALGTGPRAAAATVTVTATDPDPLVSLDTISYSGGVPGVQVGGQRYEMPSGGALQVVVLSRASNELIGNRGFTADSAGISAMDTYVKGIDDSNLVIITSPASAPALANTSATALNGVLNRIGGAFPGTWVLPMSGCWSGQQQYCYQNDTGWSGPQFGYASPLRSFTFAGVPGMELGQAWRETAVARGTTDGRLTGYLTRSWSVENPDGVAVYTIVRGADQYAKVDTCVSGGPGACVIQAGGRTFTPAAGVNGVHVVELDRQTLAPVREATVSAAGDLANVLGTSPALKGGHYFGPGQTDDRRVVILQTVGTGTLTGYSSPLLGYLDQYGATPEAFLAAQAQGKPYAFIGVADDLPWRGTGVESSPVIKSTQTGTLSAVLGRERDADFAPQLGSPGGLADFDIYDVVYQDRTPWSYAGSPALAGIARALALPPDVRSAYPSRGVDFSAKLAQLEGAALDCPSDAAAQGFTCDEYNAVRAELALEFDGVQSVRGLVDAMKAPFNASSTTQQLTAQDIATQIQNSLKPPASAESDYGWFEQFLTGVEIAEGVAKISGEEEIAGAFGVLAGAGAITKEFMGEGGGESADEITTEVAELTTSLAEQNLAQYEAMGQIELILVADQGKLLTVRQKAGTDPSWRWSAATTNDAINFLNTSARAASYSALMPPSWPIWDVQSTASQSGPTTTAQICVGEGGDNDHFYYYPFKNALAGNVFNAATAWPSTGPTTQVWVLARMSRVSSWWDNNPTGNTQLPTTSLTDQIFSSASGGADQYGPRWFRDTYDPPGRAVCYPSGTSNSFLRVPARSSIAPADVMVR
jgi:hypothetical protein